MDELVEKVARAIYREYENRPRYAQGQMNGVLAGELTQAALAAIRETHAIVPREDLERVIGLLRATDDLQENGFADDAVNIVRAMIEAASPQSPPANP